MGHLRVWRLAGERFRCVLLDPRGFGMSDMIPEAQIGDPAVCVEDVLAVLDAVGMERRSRTSRRRRSSSVSRGGRAT